MAVENVLNKPILPRSNLFVLPIIVVALSMLYVIYVEVNILLVISIIIIASLYLRERHPSFFGLVVHLAIMFSLPILIPNYTVNVVTSLVLSISLLNYIIGLTSTYDVNILRSTWPASLLLMTYSGFMGILLSFLNMRISYQAITILAVTMIMGLYRYLRLSRGIRVTNQVRVSMISGESVKYNIEVYNSINTPLYYRVEYYEKVEDLKIKCLGDYVVKGNIDYVPLEIRSSTPGIYNVNLKIAFEDYYRLVRVYKDIVLQVRVAPKTKIALLAAHRLIGRLPREIIEQAPGRRPSNVVFNPRLYVSRRGEYYGARQYVPGDDLSQIHWKKSLSKLTLISKERRQSYSPSVIILVDTSSYDNKDYANIMYSLLSTLISLSLQDPLRLVSLAIYDINNIYVLIFEDYVARILYRVIKMIEEGDISTTFIPKKILDKNIATILASLHESKISILYNYLVSSIKDKYIWRIILNITEKTSSHNVILIHGESVVSDAYLLVEYMLVRKGYTIQRPPRIPPRILYEKVLEEPIGINQ